MAEQQKRKRTTPPKAAPDDNDDPQEPKRGPTVPEGAEFVNDGTLRVHIGGKRWALRRPKVGEYKRLRELRYEVEDAKLVNLRDALLPDEPDDEENPTKRRLGRMDNELASRQRGRDATAANEKLERDWLVAVFDGDPERELKGLADKPLPTDEDDWPLWLTQPDFASQLFTHWRSVPLARGAR